MSSGLVYCTHRELERRDGWANEPPCRGLLRIDPDEPRTAVCDRCRFELGLTPGAVAVAATAAQLGGSIGEP